MKFSELNKERRLRNVLKGIINAMRVFRVQSRNNTSECNLIEPKISGSGNAGLGYESNVDCTF
jgi:hypothetical protein